MQASDSKIPVIYSIAGSDNTAGAGVQADLKTASLLGVYAATAITAITAQNHHGVKLAKYIGGEALRLQLEATYDVLHPDAVKIGMIPNAESAKIIADFIEKHNIGNVVIDPILVATAGQSLSDNIHDTSKAISDYLFPLARIVTPNIPEMQSFCGEHTKLSDPESIDREARNLMSKYGIKNLLVKGGHVPGYHCIDRLYGEYRLDFSNARVESSHTHGTGCVLSTAIACGLAKGSSLAEAVSDAKDFVYHAILKGATRPVMETHGPLFLIN